MFSLRCQFNLNTHAQHFARFLNMSFDNAIIQFNRNSNEITFVQVQNSMIDSISLLELLTISYCNDRVFILNYNPHIHIGFNWNGTLNVI